MKYAIVLPVATFTTGILFLLSYSLWNFSLKNEQVAKSNIVEYIVTDTEQVKTTITPNDPLEILDQNEYNPYDLMDPKWADIVPESADVEKYEIDCGEDCYEDGAGKCKCDSTGLPSY